MTVEFSLQGKRIWIAGHRGMVGSAIIRRLQRENCTILTVSREEVDLTKQSEANQWLAQHQPEVIFLAAAKVGGIFVNSQQPAEFLYDNLMIEANIIDAAKQYNVKKLLFLGSSCIYPKFTEQPISESALLTGPLEPTNQWYAIAKIAGIKLCQAYRQQYGCDFISAMPTNLYGPGDNFDSNTGHVIPGMMANFHTAKQNNSAHTTIWGTGKPKREFLHVDDLADALVLLMQNYSGPDPINVGSGQDLSILELAHLIAKTVEFTGKIIHDHDKPDGTPRKLLDISKIKHLGWEPKISLAAGLRSTYQWYQQTQTEMENI